MFKYFIFFVLAIIIIIFSVSYLLKPSSMLYGVSFSPVQARSLGLDATSTFKIILDDWGFKYIRLAAQWDLIEKNKGQYDFAELDYLMNEAAESDAKVILAVGRKTPRWPECHLPKWAKNLNYEDYKTPLNKYIEATVKQYKDHPALELWQVENEPFLPFGLCDRLPVKELQSEIELVHRLDSKHKIMVTDSGELSLWFRTARAADYFGTTMYRVVWNKYIGYWNYDWMPAFWFRFRLWINQRALDTSFVAELQAEPWSPGGDLASLPLDEQYRSMNLERLRKTIRYAEKTGMPRAYLWGAEWWRWLVEQGEGEIVDYVRGLTKR